MQKAPPQVTAAPFGASSKAALLTSGRRGPTPVMKGRGDHVLLALDNQGTSVAAA